MSGAILSYGLDIQYLVYIHIKQLLTYMYIPCLLLVSTVTTTTITSISYVTAMVTTTSDPCPTSMISSASPNETTVSGDIMGNHKMKDAMLCYFLDDIGL